MKGRLFIDTIDVYSKFGVFVIDSGRNDLVCYPALKKVASNDWQEEDGEEFDLSAPVLDTRELSIKFAIHGANYNLEAFSGVFSDKAYHLFEFRDMGRSYRLRLVSTPNLSQAHRLGYITLRFADDFPMEGYVYQVPINTIVPRQGFKLDNVDFSQYGVWVLQGIQDEIKKLPPVKKNLLRNLNSKSGAIYDGEKVTFQSKDVKLNCLMRASTLQEFWRNYDAFLFDLVRAGERAFHIDTTNSSYKCYYKNCSVSDFYPVNKIWFAFSVTLVFV